MVHWTIWLLFEGMSKGSHHAPGRCRAWRPSFFTSNSPFDGTCLCIPSKNPTIRKSRHALGPTHDSDFNNHYGLSMCAYLWPPNAPGGIQHVCLTSGLPLLEKVHVTSTSSLSKAFMRNTTTTLGWHVTTKSCHLGFVKINTWRTRSSFEMQNSAINTKVEVTRKHIS